LGRLQQFISELKRRRVIRALIGWGVFSFAVLQVVEPVLHAYHLPDGLLTVVVTVLGAGFPVTAILAWVFDITAKGITRTAPAADGGPLVASVPRLAVLLLGLGLLAAAPGLVYFFVWPGTGRRVTQGTGAGSIAQGMPSIAVLPFANLSSDREQEYLGDGIAEEITTKLSRLKGLTVAARTAVARFKGATQSPSEIGGALGVGYLLEGSVRRAGDRIRVTTSLLKASDGFQVWSDDADAKVDDIFSVQERIAARTVEALALKLSPDERRSLSDWGTQNAAAYDEYLRGQVLYELVRSREQFEASRSHFERALSIDPQFAPALAGLASVEAQIYRDFDSDPRRLARAEELTRRALAISPRLGRALMAAGELAVAHYDYAGAAASFAQVVADEPKNYVAWDLLCWAEGYCTPARATEAEEACRRSLAINPGHLNAHYHLARALLHQGRIAEAGQAIAALDEGQPGSTLSHVGHFWLELFQGRPREALASMADQPATPLSLAWRAMARAQLGELNQAFADLEGALAGGYRDAGDLQSSSWFAPLRKDPRFETLMAKYQIGR